MSKKVSPEQQHKIDVVVEFLCRPPYETGGYPDDTMAVGDTYVFATCREGCEPNIYHHTEQELVDWYDRADAMAESDGKRFSDFLDPKLHQYGPMDFDYDDWRIDYFYETEKARH